MAKKAKKAPAKKAGPKLVKGAKSAKKSAAKKPARVWESNRGAERAAAAKKTTKAPAQVPLIKGLRIPSLDRHCRHIGDQRAGIARMQAELKDMERLAHEDMRKHRRETWQSAGVTLVRVPGEERLRVTTSRSGDSTAPADTPVADEVEDQDEPTQTAERTEAVDQVDDPGGVDGEEDQVH